MAWRKWRSQLKLWRNEIVIEMKYKMAIMKYYRNEISMTGNENRRKAAMA
jgi:hypothetical protein